MQLRAFYRKLLPDPSELDGEEGKKFILSHSPSTRDRSRRLQLDRIQVMRLKPTVYAIIYKYKLGHPSSTATLLWSVMYNIEYYGQVCREGQVPDEMLYNRDREYVSDAEKAQRARHPLGYEHLGHYDHRRNISRPNSTGQAMGERPRDQTHSR